MKNIFTCIVLFSALPLMKAANWKTEPGILVTSSSNLFVITLDGFRWQEIFNGADPDLLHNPAFTPDSATMELLYGGEDPLVRRKKLLPFIWNVLAAKGQLYGNRHHKNLVNTANLYAVSYPGYNEIFTGHTDITIAGNRKKKNGNRNVLEFLDGKDNFKGKVAAFTSWDVFPYILNEERSQMLINSGYEVMEGDISQHQEMINVVQSEAVAAKNGTRYDQLTFLTAREYIKRNYPRVVFIGLGETDEFAHQGRYDLYLEQANKIDRMIAELWHLIQSTPEYKDKTSLLITTDHGRGSRASKWTSHSAFIKGSSETWLALMGPGVEPLGEMKGEQQFYQQQIAPVIAKLVGEKF